MCVITVVLFLTPMVLWCHRTVISSKNSQPNIICILQSKDVFTASAPISIEINTTFFARGGTNLRTRHIFLFFEKCFLCVCGYSLSFFVKSTQLVYLWVPFDYHFFGGHLGCLSSSNSGFGLVWNTKNEVFCLFLFYSGRYEFPSPAHPSRHLHLN